MNDREPDSNERHERVSDLFLQACELAPEARDAFLIEAAGEDESLLRELQELLAHDPGGMTSSGAKLDADWAQVALDTSGAGAIPRRLGAYDVIERLGEGGMGVVYRGRQRSPDRDVALKVVPLDFAHPDAVRRFEMEAELLGRLRHPGIAQIFEAGVDRSGPREQPFFAMELVDGRNLSEWAREERPSSAWILELLAQIGEAVAHAHQNGVVHRDLKPSNILMDGDGRPRVLDFGVARALDESPSGTVLTRTGQLVGTLPYMSPEQVSGDPLSVDTRTDVYSLGVVGYELLTGQLPLEVSETPLVEAARRISEEQPTPLGQLDKRLRGDVSTVISKAMSKDKERRYASVSAFVEDLRRVLAHEVIAARPPSTLYQLSRLAKRNRALAAGVSIALLALVVGFGVALVEANRANREASRAVKQTELTEAALAESDAVVDYLSELLQAVHPAELGREVLVSDVLLLAPRRAERLEAAGARARIYGAVGRAWQALGVNRRASEALESSLKLLLEAHGEEDPRTIDTRAALAVSLAQEGRDELALEMARKAHTQAAARYGAESMEAVDLWAVLGGIEQNLGQLEAARDKLLYCVDRGGVFAQDDPRHLEHLQSLAGLEREFGRFDEGLRLMQIAYQRAEESLGSDHWQTLSLGAGLGLELYSNAQFDEAITVLEPTRERLLDLHGREHSLYLQATEFLGMALLESNEFERAEALLSETLATNESVHGAENPISLTSKRYMLQLRMRQGQSHLAVTLAEDLLASLQRVEGEDHPDTIEALQALGGIHMEHGRHEEAERLLADAVERAERVLPLSNPTRIQAGASLATVLRHQGRTDEALALLSAVEQDGAELLGDIAITYWHSQALRGALLCDRGQFEEGLEILRLAVSSHDEAVGAESPLSLQLHEALGRALLKSSDTEGASGVYRRARETALQVLGPEADLTLRLTASSAECLQVQGDHAEGAELIERHLETAGGDLPQRNPRGVMLLTRLASLYDAAEREEDALVVRRESLDALRGHYGPEHPDVWVASYNLARAEFNAGEFSHAEDLLRGGLDALPVQGLGSEWNARFSIDLAAVLRGDERHDEALEVLQESRAHTAALEGLDAAWLRGLDSRIEKIQAFLKSASAQD